MRNYFKQHHTLRYPFSNSNIIEMNCSQAYQDLFVLSVLDGKTNGRYVEIGAENPVDINNTFLLEGFGWEGYSLEISRNWENDWKNIRKNELIIHDATKFDHKSKLKELNWDQIDYLQVDTEPPETTLKCLYNFPFDEVKVSVITYETDVYSGNSSPRTESRKYLKDLGYEMVCSDVCYSGNPFEDWYVNPDLVESHLWERFRCNNAEASKIFVL
jgi:hypothetical protein